MAMFRFPGRALRLLNGEQIQRWVCVALVGTVTGVQHRMPPENLVARRAAPPCGWRITIAST